MLPEMGAEGHPQFRRDQFHAAEVRRGHADHRVRCAAKPDCSSNHGIVPVEQSLPSRVAENHRVPFTGAAFFIPGKRATECEFCAQEFEVV